MYIKKCNDVKHIFIKKENDIKNNFQSLQKKIYIHRSSRDDMWRTLCNL